jgi:hypothetical protein
MGLLTASSSLTLFLKNQILKIVTSKQKNIKSLDIIKSELEEIADFCSLKINALLDASANTESVSKKFDYDILNWIEDQNNKRLSDYKFENNEKVELYFEFTEDQINMRKDLFKRYGTDINAVSKIMTRIDSLEGQYRKVRIKGDHSLRDIYKKIGDTNIRYTLAN